MPEHEIIPSDMHCGGCSFYLGLGACVLPSGCCVLADPEGFEAVPDDWDGTVRTMKTEGDAP